MMIRFEIRAEPETFPYALIGQTGYGIMDSSTTVKGLAISGLASLVAIVCHCPELQRTALIYSPTNDAFSLTLKHIFDWVISNGEATDRNNSLTAVIIYGYKCLNSTQQTKYDVIVNEFRKFLHSTYSAERTTTLQRGYLLESSNGSMLVDKVTAKITILGSPPDDHIYAILSPPHYTQEQLARAIFCIDIFSNVFICNGMVPAGRHLQFDMNHFTLQNEIPDECRLLLRVNFGVSGYSDLKLHSAIEHMKLDRNEEVFEFIKKGLRMCMSLGMPCECCSNKGTFICQSCEGAWYCSSEHMINDWPIHARFCNLYSVTYPTSNGC